MKRGASCFDFTAAIRAVCVDMVGRLGDLSHIDMQRVAIGFSRTRNATPYGVFASLTPLRFAGGTTHKTVRGRRVRIEGVAGPGVEPALYLLKFFLPRFQNLPLEEKLTTVVHELWHIGPQFDGDLRRHEGRCYAHGHSRRAYDAEMARLAQRWLAYDPPSHLYEFLERNFTELAAEHGGVRGDRWPTPKIVPA